MKGKSRQLVENIFSEIIQPVQYIVLHFKLFLNVLIHPLNTLSKESSKVSPLSGKFLFVFWLFNIIIVYWFGSVFGLTSSSYPFPVELPFKIPILSDFTDNIVSIYLRHVIGVIIFLGLFKFIMGSEKFKIIKLRIAKMFFLSSAIFFPYCLIQICCRRLFLDKYFDDLKTPLMQVMQHLFSGGELLIKDFMGILAKVLKGELVFIAINMIFIIWWFWFMRSGLKFIKILNVHINRIFIKVCIWFVVIQVVFGIIFGMSVFLSGMKPYLIINSRKVEIAISENPPNYEKAAKLCEMVVKNKYSPDYFKYVGAVRNLEYGMAAFSFLPSSRKFIYSVLGETSNWSWRGDYRKIQLKMNSYYEKEFSKVKDNGHSMEDILCQFKEKLIKIEELYNSKGFIYETAREAETLSFGVCCFSVGDEDIVKENVLSINNQKKGNERIKINNLGVFVNVCAWGQVFVIFPEFSSSQH